MNFKFSSILVLALFFWSCTEEIKTEQEPIIKTIEEKIVVMKYDVDTANTIINWRGYEGVDKTVAEYHEGTVKAVNGSFEITDVNGTVTITDAELEVDMNTIKEGNNIEKLEKHLKSPDFFNVQNFTHAKFIYEKYEDDALYGFLKVMGKELPLSTKVDISYNKDSAVVLTDSFVIDFSTTEMPFFIEDAKQPVKDQHNPNLEFNMKVVGK